MIDALDKDKLLVLDLWCETQENWRSRNNFNGTPWLWCTIHNFGGNVGLGGRLAWVGEGPAQALADPAKGRFSGIGALMEGTGSNPALWERFFENAWRSSAPSLGPWLNDYARRRYGAAIPAAEQAWQILAGTLYGPPASRIEYPINSAVCARPSLKPEANGRMMGTTQPNYDTTRLVEAWRLLIEAAPQAAGSEGYRHDLADVGREVLAGLGTRYHRQMLDAYRAKDAAALRAHIDRMLGLISDMDDLVGTRREFLLGVWLQDARRWGETKEEKAVCERNARELLTLWNSTYNITDYANRQWNGLLGSFYHHRWEMWAKALSDSLAKGVPIDEAVVPRSRSAIGNSTGLARLTASRAIHAVTSCCFLANALASTLPKHPTSEHGRDQGVAPVYQRRKHFINLFIWPSTRGGSTKENTLAQRGYNLVHWTQGGMDCWAVSDVNRGDLQEFTQAVRRVPR